jgi:glycine/D-amino acid oxidase-like deaminating enzyme
MRVCILGGGIAGTLLAWRLAARAEVEHVELLLGDDGRPDATGLSGGVVRAYERHPEGRRLAASSLAELRCSPVLRSWADYRETGAVYLCRARDALDGELHEIDERLPGSVRLATAGELERMGWAGLPAGVVGVVERSAGHIAAGRLRAALLADLADRPEVRVVRASAGVVVHAGGGVTTTVAGERRAHDVAVLATGAWTPEVLRASGLSVTGLRTKAIRCATFAVAGRAPVPFADETSGLYGTPTADGRLLLGIATHAWDVEPGRREACATPTAAIARLAAARLPRLRLGRVLRTVDATDCYGDPPVLALRAVAGEDGAVWTFTGGSGGSVKTALAASREAAEQLLGVRRPALTTTGK